MVEWFKSSTLFSLDRLFFRITIHCIIRELEYVLRGCVGQIRLEKETLLEHISSDQIPVKVLSILNKLNKKEEKQLPNCHLIFFFYYLLLTLMVLFLFQSFFSLSSSMILSFIIWLWSSVSNVKDMTDILSFAWPFNQNLEP